MVSKKTYIKSTVATGGRWKVFEVLKLVPVSFGEAKTILDLLVVEGDPFYAVFGNPNRSK